MKHICGGEITAGRSFVFVSKNRVWDDFVFLSRLYRQLENRPNVTKQIIFSSSPISCHIVLRARRARCPFRFNNIVSTEIADAACLPFGAPLFACLIVGHNADEIIGTMCPHYDGGRAAAGHTSQCKQGQNGGGNCVVPAQKNPRVKNQPN